MDKNLDIWHYKRSDLATRLLTSINSGIVNNFVIFAPRRIGKTEFLTQDLKPLAMEENYHVIYFNFYNESPKNNTVELFSRELKQSLNSSLFEKIEISKINLPWCQINLKQQTIHDLDLNQLICLLVAKLEKQNKKLLLLLDEIQELAFKTKDKWFIGSLRTTLDLNKSNVKVVFTGSSRTGLRNIFHNAYAPFFHFAANLEFNYFDKNFTDFLADKYELITNKTIDKEKLYVIFVRLNKITLYIREIINILILQPMWNLDETFNYYIKELTDNSQYEQSWNNLSIAEKIILLAVVSGINNFYSHEFKEFCKERQIEITKGQLQYAVKKLIHNLFLIQNLEQQYEINDSFLKLWLESTPINLVN